MDQCHSGLKSLGTIVDGSLSNPVMLSASKAGRFVGDSLSSNKLGYHCSSTNMAYSKTAAANTEPITAGPGRTFVTDSHASGLVFFFLAWQQILEKTHWLQKSVQLISCSPPVLPARHVSCTSLVVSVSLASYSSAYGRVRVALPASSSRPCNEIFPDRVSHKYGQTH